MQKSCRLNLIYLYSLKALFLNHCYLFYPSLPSPSPSSMYNVFNLHLLVLTASASLLFVFDCKQQKQKCIWQVDAIWMTHKQQQQQQPDVTFVSTKAISMKCKSTPTTHQEKDINCWFTLQLILQTSSFPKRRVEEWWGDGESVTSITTCIYMYIIDWYKGLLTGKCGVLTT